MTRLTGKQLPPHAEAVLRAILQDADIESCDVISVNPDGFRVAPSSIPAEKKGQLVIAIMNAVAAGKVSKFLRPPQDSAYHLEIPKESQ